VLLFLEGDSIKVLMFTLLLATPSLSLIGTIGASLIVGVKNSGMLLSLLILPLYIPILIFASSAVSQAQFDLEISSQLYFLSTILIVSLMGVSICQCSCFKNKFRIILYFLKIIPIIL
jgi:ABC-type transport system involved in cytochrome c biogenesis, permease component